jgi:hypothetical protein
MIQSERPNVTRRLIGSGDDRSVGELNTEGVAIIQSDVSRGLPDDLERLLLESFEFDGLFVEWPEKGHTISMVGMQKFGDVLAWQLDVRQAGGRHWYLYLDSHSGDIVRAYILDENDEPTYIIGQSDFRESSGFRFPHRIEYMDGTGAVLALETIDVIEIDVIPFELEPETVAH